MRHSWSKAGYYRRVEHNDSLAEDGYAAVTSTQSGGCYLLCGHPLGAKDLGGTTSNCNIARAAGA